MQSDKVQCVCPDEEVEAAGDEVETVPGTSSGKMQMEPDEMDCDYDFDEGWDIMTVTGGYV